MSEPTYPDAYLKDNKILCIKTDTELCSYEGLVLANVNGRFCILCTTMKEHGRAWDLIQWGSTLSTTEIQRYLKEK
jgi:hypothetical protein